MHDITGSKELDHPSDTFDIDFYRAAKGYKYLVDRNWESDSKDVSFEVEKPKHIVAWNHASTVYFEEDDFIARVTLGSKVVVTVLSDDRSVCDAFVERIEALVPKRTDKDDGLLQVRFWHLTGNGPRGFTRRIVAPEMPEILDNYAAGVKDELARLTSPSFIPGQGGQLLLWHGPPGTGKTWALRGLGKAWRKWASIEYIVDPEVFFGNAGYLLSLALDENSPQNAFDEDDEKSGWRLLVFEDTGELIGKDAKAETGQGLARLLNVVDGFIGQGLRIMVLITTNDTLDGFHPAVIRPGRNASTIGFENLSSAETHEWAARHGIADKVTGSKSLAELFATREEWATSHRGEAKRKTRPIGFGAEKVA